MTFIQGILYQLALASCGRMGPDDLIIHDRHVQGLVGPFVGFFCKNPAGSIDTALIRFDLFFDHSAHTSQPSIFLHFMVERGKHQGK
jgi:hypothetical protein